MIPLEVGLFPLFKCCLKTYAPFLQIAQLRFAFKLLVTFISENVLWTQKLWPPAYSRSTQTLVDSELSVSAMHGLRKPIKIPSVNWFWTNSRITVGIIDTVALDISFPLGYNAITMIIRISTTVNHHSTLSSLPQASRRAKCISKTLFDADLSRLIRIMPWKSQATGFSEEK